MSEQVKDVLREADSSSAKYFAGDIFRQVRISTLAGDRTRRKKWLARLDTNPRRNLLKVEAMPMFLDSLDDLIPFTGLWPAVYLGTFPRYSNLHCTEVSRPMRNVESLADVETGADTLLAPNQRNMDLHHRRERGRAAAVGCKYCRYFAGPLSLPILGRSSAAAGANARRRYLTCH